MLTGNSAIAKDAPSFIGETKVMKDASVSNASHDIVKTASALKFTYKEDQWSPLNPEGKKQYDREFLLQMQLQPISLKKPSNLPNLEIIKDKAQLHKLTDVNRAPLPPMPRQYADPFMPTDARPPQRRIEVNEPAGMELLSDSGEALKEVKDSCASNTDQDSSNVESCSQVKLHKSSNAWKPSHCSKQSIENEKQKNELPHLNRKSSVQGPKHKKAISISISLNQVVKLHEFTNAWKPPQHSKQDIEHNEELKNQAVYKKVRGILNKITPQKFATLVKQLKDLEVNTEERLKGVADLVHKKAISEPKFSVVYANMCKQIALLKVPLDGQDGYINFRKLLLTECQKEFEQVERNLLRIGMKTKIIEDNVANEKRKQLIENFEEEEKKNRRKQLGNIQFIGELFKVGMLIELIMHECIKKLLHQGDEDSLECLCQLLSTMGKELEMRKEKESVEEYNGKKAMINGYFDEIQKIVDKRHTSSRVRFMLQDVIELKKKNWIPRHDNDAPKTIDKIRKEAEREAHEQQQILSSLPFVSKQQPLDDRWKSMGRNPNFKDSSSWNTISSNKTSKANCNIDPQELQLCQNVEYTVVVPSQTVAQPIMEMSHAEIKKKLDVYLSNDSKNNDQILDFIESHLHDRTSEPTFIRALVTAVFENAISGSEDKCELNTEKLKNRMSLFTHYIARKDEAELQTLYALQALIQRLGQPKGILNQIFDILYEEEVINEGTFDKWEKSDDPAEQEGKGVALGSVNSFFTWLREADNNSPAEDW